MTSEKLLERISLAAECVKNNIGKDIYLLDSIFCDECPDASLESCPMHDGPCPVSDASKCRKRRLTIRAVRMDDVNICMEKSGKNLYLEILFAYECDPAEVFSDFSAAEQYLLSLPGDIQKFRQPGPDGRRANYSAR